MKSDERDTSPMHCRRVTILFELALQWYDTQKKPISIKDFSFLMTKANEIYEEEYMSKQEALF